MHAIAYVMKRKPGLTEEEFAQKYAAHGALMAQVAKGLLRYEQFPKRVAGFGDLYSSQESAAYDAVSVYVFESAEAAGYTAQLPEVLADCDGFIDFDSMITVPVTPRLVV